MRPEDLKTPSSWDRRSILIHDRIWYIPGYYNANYEFSFPGWESVELFGNTNPVRVEYCSGNGAWIAAKAAEDPNSNWVAVEKKFIRVRKIWSKIKNLQLNNLIAVCGEGYNATRRYFPTSSVSDIYINFPDPWPKLRHAKHRLIQSEFISEMHRTLRPEAPMTFVTDDIAYSEWMIQKMESEKGFRTCYPKPYYSTEYEGYGTSYFDQLWREKGRRIRYHKFEKISPE